MSYSVLVAGSTFHTLLCAKALQEAGSYTISGVLTPEPKPVGRKQILTSNPLHIWAKENNIPTILVQKSIDHTIKDAIEQLERPDILLVVDFGYIIPSWLLQFPTLAPINIHPSDLPKFRGSSPGQFVLLFAEPSSAVSVIIMDEKLDHGPIIAKVPLTVQPTWTQKEYYEHAFALVSEQLATIVTTFIQSGRASTPQPDESPTPIARQFVRDDGFVPYTVLTSLLKQTPSTVSVPLLQSYGIKTSQETLYHMYCALTPWPGLWTTVMIAGEQKRMKIIKMSYNKAQLILDTVQIEGKTEQPYSQIELLR